MIHQFLKRILGLFGSKQSSVIDPSFEESSNELDKNLSAEEANELEYVYYTDGKFFEAFKYFMQAQSRILLKHNII